jgi:hypothetical protein
MILNVLLLAYIQVIGSLSSDAILLEYKQADGVIHYLRPPAKGPQMASMFPLTRNQKAKAPKLAAIRVSLFLDSAGTPKIEPAVLIGSTQGFNADVMSLPGEPLGVYTLPVVIGESLTINAFERYGLEPMVLRVVSANPDTPRSLEIVNRTKSLEIIRSEEFRDRHELTVRNNSSRPVIAYSLGTSLEDPRTTESAGKLNSLIEPGGSRQFSLTFGPSERQLVIRAVVFADLGWEGHPQAAAEMLAWRQGEIDAEARILRLIDSISGGMDGRAAERLVAGIKAIPDVDDEAAVQTVIAACGLAESDRSAVRNQYREGISATKRRIVGMIDKWGGGVPINSRLRNLRRMLVRE